MFVVPHLVMAIKASEFYQHLAKEKKSQEKLYIFAQQFIIELRYSWLLTTFQCNLVTEIVSKNLKHKVFKFLKFLKFQWKRLWEGEVYVNFQQNRDFKNKFLCSKTKIEICLQKFSTDQRFQKQIFCVAKLKMILKVVFISKTSLCFFEKL